MLFSEIGKKIDEKGYEQKLKYPKKGKLNPNHIFDENLSVKENRKMAEDYNQKIDKEKQEYREEGYKLREEFHDDVLSALIEEYSFSKEIANIILERANVEYSDCLKQEFIVQVEDLGDFVQKIVENLK